MGLTHVQVTVRNPADLSRSWEGAFLVDTGAIDSLVPRDRLEQIGLRPRDQRTYELADGREAVMDIAVAELEFMGEIVGATIVVGEEGTEPLLGVTALESLGIEVDPMNQQLKKLPSLRLKGAGGPPARPRPAVEAAGSNDRELSRTSGAERHDAGAPRAPERPRSAAAAPYVGLPEAAEGGVP